MRSLSRAYLLNVSLLGAALVLSVAFGAVAIPPAILARILASFLGSGVSTADWPETFTTIVYQIRLPHAILMALTGAALGGGGATYQGLFRNPLADPYLIGVASGAGLGAVLAITLAASLPPIGLYTVPAAAFLGALITVLVVYALARSGRAVPTTTLILAGVAVGSFATSLTSFLLLSTQGEVRRALAWLLGGYTLTGWAPVWVVLPYLSVGLAALLAFGHPLNVLQFGDEQAQQLGLPVERIRTLAILAASLTTAAAVSFSGIIGFVGLIVPHLARLLWGVDYRHLIPLSILGGATCLLVADLLSRLVLAPQEVPVGILTALAGVPFFLWVLRRSQSALVRD